MKRIAIIMFSLLCFSLASCGGNDSVSKLSCSDFFYGETIEIRYNVSHGHSPADFFTSFLSNDDINTLCKKISDTHKNYNFEIIYGDTIRLEYIEDGKKILGYIMLRSTSEDDETIKQYGDYKYRYVLWDFEGMMELDANNEFAFVFPYNLIDKNQLEDIVVYFECGKKYTTKYSESDYLNFYNEYGIFDIEETEAGFTVNGITDDNVTRENITFPIEFKFFSEESGNSFSINY